MTRDQKEIAREIEKLIVKQIKKDADILKVSYSKGYKDGYRCGVDDYRKTIDNLKEAYETDSWGHYEG